MPQRSSPKAKAKKSTKNATRKKTASTKRSQTKKTTEPLAIVAKRISTTTTTKRNPLGHLLLEKSLREAGFTGEISTNKKVLESYSTDESIFCIRPQVVLIPNHRKDVEIATQVVAKETQRFSSLSLTPRAAGTGLSGGSLTDSVVIDVKHLNAMGDITSKGKKYTFTCEPGLYWRDMEKVLAKKGLYLPPYTSSKDICTIGGSVANNAAGPDSLRYGHCADWVESLEVVLSDGQTYTFAPLTYKEYKKVAKQKTEYARIVREIYELAVKNEKEIIKNKPKTKKNSSGYALWHVFSDGAGAFAKGEGTFDITRLIAGSQGTLGMIVGITMRALPIQKKNTLLAIPIFDLTTAADTIVKTLKYNPLNIEIFDALTYQLALKNPEFFKQRLSGLTYLRAMLAMYTTYHVRYGGKTPEFVVLVTLDEETTKQHSPSTIVRRISSKGIKARVVNNPFEAEMFWQIRRASYTLSKFQDTTKRPAAFLEDMTVPPENLSKFFTQIKRLFKEFNVTAAVHGHGGNGHFHFYPLLDFTNKTTGKLIEKMADAFYDTAIKYDGDICGEHNDGIIRTPYLNKMFTKKMLGLFEDVEHIFDPHDIFNPGKKVNPRFDIKHNIRTTN